MVRQMVIVAEMLVENKQESARYAVPRKRTWAASPSR